MYFWTWQVEPATRLASKSLPDNQVVNFIRRCTWPSARE